MEACWVWFCRNSAGRVAPFMVLRWPLGWLNGRKADQYDVGFLMKTKISCVFAGSGPTVSPAARCIDVSRHPKMQKLLKAMPDVRRDYVRELDTALVESRAKPENRRAWKTQHFNCDTKTQDNTRYTRGWFLIYFPATNSFLWVSQGVTVSGWSKIVLWGSSSNFDDIKMLREQIEGAIKEAWWFHCREIFAAEL